MAMANMNLIGVFVTQLWPIQVLACGGEDGGEDGAGDSGGDSGGGDGSATKNILTTRI